MRAGTLEIEFGEGPTRNAARWRQDSDMMMILTCLCGLPNLENACARKREICGPCLGTEEYFWRTVEGSNRYVKILKSRIACCPYGLVMQKKETTVRGSRGRRERERMELNAMLNL